MKKFLLFVSFALFSVALWAQTDISSALKQTSAQFSKNLREGIKIAVIGISSDSNELSKFILNELTNDLVQERKWRVVTRNQLDKIEREMGYQQSGAVSEESMKSLGRQVGADTIITGSLEKFGQFYILDVQALDVESAAINDVFHSRIDDDETIALLTGKKVISKNGKITKNSTDYTAGERVGIGFQNILAGLGSYRNGHIGDGIAMSVLDAVGILCILGDSEGELIEIGAACIGVAVIYGFIRPIFYHKTTQESVSLNGVQNGFQFAIAPKHGEIAAKCSYRISF